MKVNKELVKQALAEINKKSIEELLKRRKLLKEGYTKSGNVFKIPCIFHEDADPSLNIDLDDGKWQCFSCKRSGKYMAMFMFILEIIDKKPMNFYQAVEYILKNDALLRSRLGVKSIYINNGEKTNLTELITKFDRVKPKLEILPPLSYLELVNKLKQESLIEDQILKTLFCIQNDFSPAESYELVKGNFESKVEYVEKDNSGLQLSINLLEDLM